MTDWEAPEHRVVLPESLQYALRLDIPVLRWSAVKRDRVLSVRPKLRERVERIGELLVDWIAAGCEPGEHVAWHVLFRDGNHLNDMVFGDDASGSWNVITVYPLRGAQISRMDAAWMVERQRK